MMPLYLAIALAIVIMVVLPGWWSAWSCAI